MNLTINPTYSLNTSNKTNFGNTICILKPNLAKFSDLIIERHIMNPRFGKFKVLKMKKFASPEALLRRQYRGFSKEPDFDKFIKYISRGEICVMEIKGGKNDVADFKKFVTEHLSPIFDNDGLWDKIHYSDNPVEAEKELYYWKPLLDKYEKKFYYAN